MLVLTAGLGDDAMQAWGWRIPFLIGGPLGAIGLYLRLRLEDTPAFTKSRAGSGAAAARPTGELREIFRRQKRTLLLCMALVAAYNVASYMLLTYMPTHLTDALDWPTTGQLGVVVGTMVVMLAGMVGFLVTAAPAFALLRLGSVAAVIPAMLLLGLSHVCLLGSMSATLPAPFPTDIRYGSLAVGYTMAFAVIGIVAVRHLEETARRPLKGSPPAVATQEEAAELAGQRSGG